MVSTKGLEDTLPFYSAGSLFYPDNIDPHPVKAYNVYTLLSLDVPALEHLVDELNAASLLGDDFRLVQTPVFVGRTLRDIYDYHLRVRKEDDSIHPYFFIVADQEDWDDKGV